MDGSEGCAVLTDFVSERLPMMDLVVQLRIGLNYSSTEKYEA